MESIFRFADLIEEHAPNLKAFFEKNPNVASALKAADGNMYYIPYLPDGKYGRAYFMRTDWLDKLGLKAPENVDELKTTLEAFPITFTRIRVFQFPFVHIKVVVSIRTGRTTIPQRHQTQ